MILALLLAVIPYPTPMMDSFPPGFEWYAEAFSDGNAFLWVRLRNETILYRPGQLWPDSAVTIGEGETL